MKKRHVYSTPDLATARRAVDAARAAGVADEGISLVASATMEMDSIPPDRLDVSTDTVPAAMRGAGAGAVIGLVAGIVAVAIPAIGITVAGAGLLTLIGAAVGGWSSALAGSSFPNSVRQAFESEVEAGRVLVVIDDNAERAQSLHEVLASAGARQLPFDEPSALV